MEDSRENRIRKAAYEAVKKKLANSGNNDDDDDDLIKERTIRYLEKHYEVDEDRSKEVSNEDSEIIVVCPKTSYFEIWVILEEQRMFVYNKKNSRYYYSEEELTDAFIDTYDIAYDECIRSYDRLKDLLFDGEIHDRSIDLFRER